MLSHANDDEASTHKQILKAKLDSDEARGQRYSAYFFK